MKPINRLLVLAVLLAPGLVSAQGYYGGPGGGTAPPIPGGFHNRGGRLTYGGSLGLGYMNDNGNQVSCNGCSQQPITVEGDIHIGGMLSPRFALLFEAQVNVQQVSYTGFNDVTLNQDLAMIAGQYWITPQFWIKGGIGAAHVQLIDNAFGASVYDPQADGLALMGGAGFELLSARFFAVDLQGRLAEGSYHGTGDHVTSGTIGVGINWY